MLSSLLENVIIIFVYFNKILQIIESLDKININQSALPPLKYSLKSGCFTSVSHK